MKVKCIKCDRQVWSVSRNRQLVEYRNTRSRKSTDSQEDYQFDSNWKKEKESLNKEMYVRCQSCNYKFDLKDYKGDDGVSEVKITNKGIYFIHNRFEKFFGGDDE